MVDSKLSTSLNNSTMSSSTNHNNKGQQQFNILTNKEIETRKVIFWELSEMLKQKLKFNEEMQKENKQQNFPTNSNKSVKSQEQKKNKQQSHNNILKNSDKFLIKEARQIKAQLNYVKEMEQILNEGKEFKVLVCGIQSSGKSTFINANIGQDILPSTQIGQTKHLQLIKYSDNSYPILMKYDQKKKYLIKMETKNIKELIMENDELDETEQNYYEMLAHFDFLKEMPSLFKNKFVFIDSPGFNSQNLEQWQNLVGDNIENKFDFIILVIAIDQLQDRNYQQAIAAFFKKESVKNAVTRNQLIVVINKIDQEKLYSRDQLVLKIQDDINKICQDQINPKICIISAYRALFAKIITSANLNKEQKFKFGNLFYDDVPEQFRNMIIQQQITENNEYQNLEAFTKSNFDEFQRLFINDMSVIFGRELDTVIQTIQIFLTGFNVDLIYNSLSTNNYNFQEIQKFMLEDLTNIEKQFKQDNFSIVKQINLNFQNIAQITKLDEIRIKITDNFKELLLNMQKNFQNYQLKSFQAMKTLLHVEDTTDIIIKQQIENFQNYQKNISEIQMENEIREFLQETQDEDVVYFFGAASTVIGVLSGLRWTYLGAQAIVAGISLPLFIISIFGAALMFGLGHQKKKKNLERMQEKCKNVFNETIITKFQPIFEKQFSDVISNIQELFLQILQMRDNEQYEYSEKS